jgi:hypothetical protein
MSEFILSLSHRGKYSMAAPYFRAGSARGHTVLQLVLSTSFELSG